MATGALSGKVLSALPFSLTNGQEQAIKAIRKDMRS